MIRIWWCEEHGGSAVEDLQHCWKRQWLEDVGGAFEPCRMVEMRLVSVDALVVDRLRPSTSDLIAELVERGVLIGDDYEEAK